MNQLASSPAVARFGVFELDMKSGELYKNGRRVSLPDQPYRVLKLLLERHGQLVTREELRQQLWAQDTFVDFEHGLNAAVKKLRDALGDRAESPRFIETLPKRGYRFIAPVADSSPAAHADAPSDRAPVLPQTAIPSRSRPHDLWRPTIVVAAAVALIALVLSMAAGWRRDPPPRGMRVMVPSVLDGLYRDADVPLVSPDGRRLAFGATDVTGTRQVWVQEIDSSVAKALPGTDDVLGGADVPSFSTTGLAWSPDGRQVAYRASSRIRVATVDGGTIRTIADGLEPYTAVMGLAWLPSNELVFSGASMEVGLLAVPASGGRTREVTKVARARNEWRHGMPSALPDGRHFLYLVEEKDRRTLQARFTVWIGSLDGVAPRFLMEAESRGSYVPPGYVVYVQNGSLMAQPFDDRTLQTVGDAMRVAAHVDYSFPVPLAAFSTSERTLAWRAPKGTPDELMVVDRQGRRVRTIPIGEGHHDVRMSPDGKRLAVARRGARGSGVDLWVHGLANDVAFPVVADGAYNGRPVWSPDGSRLLYYRWGGTDGVFERRADGEGPIRQIVDSVEEVEFPYDVSPDGRWLLYGRGGFKQAFVDLWALPLSGEGEAVPVSTNTPESETGAVFSPDQRWVAYHLEGIEGHRPEKGVFVKPFRPDAPRTQVSVSGSAPRWRGDGRELYFLDGARVMAVDVALGETTAEIGRPRLLFEMPVAIRGYDATADGNTFAIVQPKVVDVPPPPTILSLDWTTALQR